MKRVLCLLVFVLIVSGIKAQKPEETEDWSRKPAIVTPGENGMAPSDAIILYREAKDISNWVKDNGQPAKWIADSCCITVAPKSGSINTVKSFGDCQLHIEWRSPAIVNGTGQGRGNSGILIMGKYELQVLDSYDNETYYNGQAGSIYKQHIPLVNASKGPGKWQVYDVVFTAPRFNADSTLKNPAYFTVFHNGVLIQNHVALTGPTEYIGKPVYKAHADKLPIQLQDHGNPVSYRNIWIREL